MNDTAKHFLPKFALFIAALIWGSSFFIVKNAVDVSPPNILLGIRFTVGCLLLALIFWKKLKVLNFSYLWQGSILGVLLFTAYCTQTIGITIMMESGLSFLGIGITVPTASWGTMVNEARPFLLTHPLYAGAPCICIALLIISLNLLGDGIRDALDPTLRGAK